MVCDEETFDTSVVQVDDISDEKRYYTGFVFFPSVAMKLCQSGRLCCSGDAAHCQGIGKQSYGTTFEVVGYDDNNDIFPLCFSQNVSTESEETWMEVFKAVKGI